MSTWPAETREQVLTLLRDGVGTLEVARRTGVPDSTVSRWGKAAGVMPDRPEQVRQANEATRMAWAQRRAQLVDDLGEATVKLLEKLLAAGDGPDARGWATALAIIVDKAQLLSGAATSRTEVFDAERRRQHVLAMADELAQRREANATKAEAS